MRRSNYKLARTTLADVQTSFGLAAGDRKSPSEAALWFAEAAETADVDLERAGESRIRARAWSLLAPMPVAMLDRPESNSSGVSDRSIGYLQFDGSGRYLLALSRSGSCVVHDILEDRRVLLPGGLGPWLRPPGVAKLETFSRWLIETGASS